MADNSFGRYLKKVRVARHLKQKDVGMAIGKSTAYICDLEKGRRGVMGNIDPLMLIQLSDYLNVPVTEILVRAGVIDRDLEARYGQYYKILRSKARAQRVGKCIEGCKEDIEQLKMLTYRKPDPNQEKGTPNRRAMAGKDLLISLESRVLSLEQTLTF